MSTTRSDVSIAVRGVECFAPNTPRFESAETRKTRALIRLFCRFLFVQPS